MVDAGTKVDLALRRVVDQFNGDEVVARQPEHGQAAERRPLDGPDDRVADSGVEREGPLEIADPQPDMQCAHGGHPSPDHVRAEFHGLRSSASNPTRPLHPGRRSDAPSCARSSQLCTLPPGHRFDRNPATSMSEEFRPKWLSISSWRNLATSSTPAPEASLVSSGPRRQSYSSAWAQNSPTPMKSHLLSIRRRSCIRPRIGCCIEPGSLTLNTGGHLISGGLAAFLQRAAVPVEPRSARSLFCRVTRRAGEHWTSAMAHGRYTLAGSQRAVPAIV